MPLELPAKLKAEVVQSRVCAATAVNIQPLPATAQNHAAVEFIVQPRTDVVAEIGLAIGRIEIATDVAPSGIPPAAGARRTIGHVGIQMSPAHTRLQVRSKRAFENIPHPVNLPGEVAQTMADSLETLAAAGEICALHRHEIAVTCAGQ